MSHKLKPLVRVLRGCRLCASVVDHFESGRVRRHDCPHGCACRRSRRGDGVTNCFACDVDRLLHHRQQLEIDPVLRVAWSDRQLSIRFAAPPLRRVSARAGRVLN